MLRYKRVVRFEKAGLQNAQNRKKIPGNCTAHSRGRVFKSVCREYFICL